MIVKVIWSDEVYDRVYNHIEGMLSEYEWGMNDWATVIDILDHMERYKDICDQERQRQDDDI